jgi:tetratricopeptide (TPR) repeat protein
MKQMIGAIALCGCSILCCAADVGALHVSGHGTYTNLCYALDTESILDRAPRDLAALRAELRAEPANADLWFALGYRYWPDADHIEEAGQAFEKACALAPDALMPRLYLAQVQALQNRPEEAAATFRTAYKLAREAESRARWARAVWDMCVACVVQSVDARWGLELLREVCAETPYAQVKLARLYAVYGAPCDAYAEIAYAMQLPGNEIRKVELREMAERVLSRAYKDPHAAALLEQMRAWAPASPYQEAKTDILLAQHGTVTSDWRRLCYRAAALAASPQERLSAFFWVDPNTEDVWVPCTPAALRAEATNIVATVVGNAPLDPSIAQRLCMLLERAGCAAVVVSTVLAQATVATNAADAAQLRALAAQYDPRVQVPATPAQNHVPQTWTDACLRRAPANIQDHVRAARAAHARGDHATARDVLHAALWAPGPSSEKGPLVTMLLNAAWPESMRAAALTDVVAFVAQLQMSLRNRNQFLMHRDLEMALCRAGQTNQLMPLAFACYRRGGRPALMHVALQSLTNAGCVEQWLDTVPPDVMNSVDFCREASWLCQRYGLRERACQLAERAWRMAFVQYSGDEMLCASLRLAQALGWEELAATCAARLVTLMAPPPWTFCYSYEQVARALREAGCTTEFETVATGYAEVRNEATSMRALQDMLDWYTAQRAGGKLRALATRIAPRAALDAGRAVALAEAFVAVGDQPQACHWASVTQNLATNVAAVAQWGARALDVFKQAGAAENAARQARTWLAWSNMPTEVQLRLTSALDCTSAYRYIYALVTTTGGAYDQNAAIEQLWQAAQHTRDTTIVTQAFALLLTIPQFAECRVGQCALDLWRDQQTNLTLWAYQYALAGPINAATPAMQMGYAHALLAIARTNAALDVMQQTLRSYPDDPVVVIAAAMTLVHIGRSKDAIDSLRRLLCLRPDEREAYQCLVWVYERQSVFRAGLQVYADGLAQTNLSDSTYAALACQMCRYARRHTLPLDHQAVIATLLRRSQGLAAQQAAETIRQEAAYARRAAWRARWCRWLPFLQWRLTSD